VQLLKLALSPLFTAVQMQPKDLCNAAFFWVRSVRPEAVVSLKRAQRCTLGTGRLGLRAGLVCHCSGYGFVSLSV